MTELPAWPQLKELDLDDQPLVEAALRAHPPQQSELTFTNLFIWRHAYGLRLGRLGSALCLFSWTPDPQEAFVFPPLGQADTTTVRACLELLSSEGLDAKLARVSAADLERLGLSEAEWEILPDRDNADYVYSVEQLTRLAGSDYHGKRAHIAQFEERYPFFQYRPLTPDLLPEVLALQDSWCDEKHCDLVATLRAEHSAVQEVLGNLETLGVTGGVILVDGHVEAFALGEPLNEDTVVIHIEKANGDFHGLYQLINQQFLAHEWQGFRYVNREQDLGVEGLRQAKLSYHPDHLVEKFIVRPR